MQVLLVTRSDDNDSVLMVADALRQSGHTPVRFDTDCYPGEVTVSSKLVKGRWQRRLTTRDGTSDLDAFGAIWHRRFFAAGLLPLSLGDLREACVEESRRTLYGSIAASDAFQLDPLWAVRRCDHKELQLKQAQYFGLAVPDTLISNDPGMVLQFHRQLKHRQLIAKMQHSFALYRDEQELVVFTSRLDPAHEPHLDGLTQSPMTFQPEIEKRLELRATVVGRQVFTAAVDSQNTEATKVDWRKDGLALLDAWEPYPLPPAVERALLKLTAWFGLNFAAADFIVTPQGKHVFLELNAGGEWFWLQRVPGLPVAEAIANVLTQPRFRAVAGRA